MRKFKIPVYWQMYGYVEIEAETAEEALQKAQEIENEGDGLDLPDKDCFLEDSFRIEDEICIIKELNS